jgi:hypothetical protein
MRDVTCDDPAEADNEAGAWDGEREADSLSLHAIQEPFQFSLFGVAVILDAPSDAKRGKDARWDADDPREDGEESQEDAHRSSLMMRLM